MDGQLLDVPEDAADEFGRGFRVLDRNVIGNGFEIGDRGLGPDYLSHRDRRFFACACDMLRPCASASSPRAMPSSMAIRR